METEATVGRGYYNYYHVKGRYETADGKAKTVWYDLDLSKEEIQSNNAGIGNRESAGADICRKVAEQFRGIAELNRSKYRTAEEVQDAVYAKYTSMPNTQYSLQEKFALARCEIDMTLYGTVQFGDARKVAAIKGDYTKNTLDWDEGERRSFNVRTLGSQIGNVWDNHDVNSMLMGNSRFRFSVNGMTNKLEVALLDDNGNSYANATLLDAMTKALNSGDNARHLFFNLLYDANRQGLLPSDQMAKWRLFNDFQNITGLDIRDFQQTKQGFVNEEGRNAIDIYKEALKTSKKVPSEFKEVAFDYFKKLEQDAMQYNISEIDDLTLSLEYQNGSVKLPDGGTGIDVTA